MKAAHLRDEINPFASALCGPYAELAVEDYRLRSLLAPGRDGGGPGSPRKIGLAVAAKRALYKCARRRAQRKIHLSIFRPRTDSIAAPQSRAILAAPARPQACLSSLERVHRAARTSSPPPRGLRYLLLAILLLTPLPNRAHSGVVRLPFRTLRSMILVEGRVNDSPAVFLLDTGAARTIVSAKIYGDVPFRLRGIQRNSQGVGIAGDSVGLTVNLELANHMWAGQRVAVMNLDGLGQLLGVRFDGLLGQDILCEFHSVRIDYQAHIIELEQ